MLKASEWEVVDGMDEDTYAEGRVFGDYRYEDFVNIIV